MAIEIASFPVKHGAVFHSDGTVHQRVNHQLHPQISSQSIYFFPFSYGFFFNVGITIITISQITILGSWVKSHLSVEVASWVAPATRNSLFLISIDLIFLLYHMFLLFYLRASSLFHYSFGCSWLNRVLLLLPAACCLLPPAWYRLPARCWLLATGCWLLAGWCLLLLVLAAAAAAVKYKKTLHLR